MIITRTTDDFPSLQVYITLQNILKLFLSPSYSVWNETMCTCQRYIICWGKIRISGNIEWVFFMSLIIFVKVMGVHSQNHISANILRLYSKYCCFFHQAEFSLVTWPFSVKLLWAPLVDSIYSTRIGRRKTWLVPTQYLIGAFMLLLSSHVDRWLGDADSGPPNIELLTAVFFLLNFLAATQDIGVCLSLILCLYAFFPFFSLMLMHSCLFLKMKEDTFVLKIRLLVYFCIFFVVP